MWQKDGLKPSAAIRAATAAYRNDMDYMAQWLDERAVADPRASVARAVAYADYGTWAKAEGAPVLGSRRFGEELRARGYTMIKTRSGRVVNSLRLKPNIGLQVVQGGLAGP